MTVFEGSQRQGVPRDDEAAELWKTVTDIDHAHIHLGNKKDNFWEMGETGPCGPCTEIHIDRTPDKQRRPRSSTRATPDVMEIWNLVFIQFNRNPDRTLDAAAREARRYRHGLRARGGRPARQGQQLRHRRVFADHGSLWSTDR